jgi:predicted GTPase
MNTVVLVGPQNVGKTTLIKSLCEENNNSIEFSKVAIGFDQHTTAVVPYCCGENLILIDSPGTSSMDQNMFQKAFSLVEGTQMALIFLWKYDGDINIDFTTEIEVVRNFLGMVPVLILLNQTASFTKNP